MGERVADSGGHLPAVWGGSATSDDSVTLIGPRDSGVGLEESSVPLVAELKVSEGLGGIRSVAGISVLGTLLGTLLGSLLGSFGGRLIIRILARWL
jgi:hypothetical protein